METSMEFVRTELLKFNLTDAVLYEMRGRYMVITVADEKDTENYQKAREARMIVRGKRVEVEKKRKELKEDALLYGRAVDTEAKRISSKLEEIETHLQTQEDIVGRYKERLLAEAVAKAEAEKIAKEQAVEAERLALQEERAKLEAEKQKMEEDKRRVEEEREKRAEAERRATEAEKNRVETEKRRAAELETAKAESAKKAIKETEERLRRETEERARKEREAIAKKVAEEEKAKRRDANRPDKEKLLAFAGRIGIMEFPEVKTEDAKKILTKVNSLLVKVQDFIRSECKGLE